MWQGIRVHVRPQFPFDVSWRAEETHVPVCDFTTVWSNALLTLHVQRKHTRERPWKCELLSKEFSTTMDLEQHFRTHTKEKPFECNICNKSFARVTSLYSHLNVHGGKKVFSCELCLKKFKRKESLKCHSLIHTGEKPLPCSIRKASFRDMYSLRPDTKMECNINKNETDPEFDKNRKQSPNSETNFITRELRICLARIEVLFWFQIPKNWSYLIHSMRSCWLNKIVK